MTRKVKKQFMTKWRVWDHQDSVSLSLATASPLQEPIYQVDIVTRCIDRCLNFSIVALRSSLFPPQKVTGLFRSPGGVCSLTRTIFSIV